MTLLLSLTHPQSPASARYSEIPTTTLLTDGHLTFRGRVSTFWRKTAPPLPRLSRCWWRTTRAGPAPSPGPSRWSWCWAPAPWASSRTWPCAGTARASRCPAGRRTSTSTWTATSWKWQPKQVGFRKLGGCPSGSPLCLTDTHSGNTWGSGAAGLLLPVGKPEAEKCSSCGPASPHPHSGGLCRDIANVPTRAGEICRSGALQANASPTNWRTPTAFPSSFQK